MSIALIEKLKRKLASMIICGLIDSIDDSKSIQLVKLSAGEGEEFPELERVQQFGLTSVPPANSEAVVCFVGGNRSHGIVIATESSRYRLKSLPSGAVAVYNQNGDYVKLTEDKIEIVAKETDIKSKTVYIGNETAELLDLIVQALEAINNSIVPTISGPQKLSKVLDTTLPQIQIKLATLKK